MFYHSVRVTGNQNCIYYALATQRCRRKLYVFGLFVRHVRSSGQILLPRYLMNGLNSFDKTWREYLLTPTDDLITVFPLIEAGSLIQAGSLTEAGGSKR